MAELPFLVESIEENSQEKGIFGKENKISRKKISIEKLKIDLHEIKKGLPELFKDMNKVGNYSLKHININIEISAEGGISIIGSAKIGGKGGISLTFEQS